MIVDCGELKLICKNFEPLFTKSGMSHHLSNIRLSFIPDKKILLLISTNGSVFNNSMLKIEVEPNDQKFDLLVDGGKFTGAISTFMSNTINISTKDTTLLVKDKETKSKFKFQTMPTDVFPSPVMKKDTLSKYTLDAQEFLKIVSCIVDVTQDSIKSENVKQFGVFMEFKDSCLKVYNISGMRSFAIESDTNTENPDESIAAFESREFKYLKQIVKTKVIRQDDNTKVIISIDKSTGIVSFKFSDMVIYLRKLALRLPAIYNIISKDRDCEVIADKSSLVDLLKKSSLMEDFEAGIFTFGFVKDEDLIIRVANKHDSDVHIFDGEMIITQTEGEDVFFKFNSSVLLTSLDAINDSRLSIKMSSREQILNGISHGWLITGETNKSVKMIFAPMNT